jgi:hypothetical protein
MIDAGEIDGRAPKERARHGTTILLTMRLKNDEISELYNI